MDLVLERFRSAFREEKGPALSFVEDEQAKACFLCEIPFDSVERGPGSAARGTARRCLCLVCGRVFCERCTRSAAAHLGNGTQSISEQEEPRACDFCE